MDKGRQEFELKAFRHGCELMLRRIVHAWMDPSMNPLNNSTDFHKEWWANEIRQAESHLKREKI